MGLDMSLVGKKYSGFNDMEDGIRVLHKAYELAYWRKHPDLHGYIVECFADGVDECQEIPLSREDLEQIISAVEDDDLPTTDGCFFGESGSADDQDTIAQIKKAIEWLDKNENNCLVDIYYRASW